MSARVYDYLGEAECDRRMKVFLDCIEAASEQENGFLAIKMTALGKPQLLERWSSLLLATKTLFKTFDKNADGQLDWEEFQQTLPALGLSITDEEAKMLFSFFDPDSKGVVDYVDWTERLNISDLETAPFVAEILEDEEADVRLEEDLSSKEIQRAEEEGKLVIPLSKRAAEALDDVEFKKQSPPQLVIERPANPLASRLLPLMDAEETKLFRNCLQRVDRIAAFAAQKGVRLLVDAEQTYFQPCIDHLVFRLQKRHNKMDKPFPIVYNTYQMYLKYSASRVRNDMERAIRNKFNFAGKFVRGAYMVSERQRSQELHYETPVFDTKEETDENYNSTVEQVIQAISTTHPGSSIMIASHNQESVERAVKKMTEVGLQKQSGSVFFAQLLGMSDNLTFTLGSSGYQVYKYVPYGPVDMVVPYLLRRAEENSDVLGSVSVELSLLRQELKRRLLG